jgi:RNA polymerase primary sigma factor
MTVLENAKAMGYTVELDQRDEHGSVWINVTEPRHADDRALISALSRLGFKFWPGRGYWK